MTCPVWLVWTDTLMSICASLLASNHPPHVQPMAEGLQQARTKSNCYRVTDPSFTPEHSKPILRSRTCIFHSVTVRIRTYSFSRHSDLTDQHFRSFFPFPALPFASIVKSATGSRTSFARDERIWGRFLGKTENRNRRILGVGRA